MVRAQEEYDILEPLSRVVEEEQVRGGVPTLYELRRKLNYSFVIDSCWFCIGHWSPSPTGRGGGAGARGASPLWDEQLGSREGGVQRRSRSFSHRERRRRRRSSARWCFM